MSKQKCFGRLGGGMIAGALLWSATAQGADFGLSLTADQGSRWYEYFSDAFAELGTQRSEGGDGFWLISEWEANGSYVPVGDGSPRVFPTNGIFTDVGMLTYTDAGLSGSGTEVANVTGLTMNFNPFIADNDSIVDASGYTTTINSVSGTVTLENGVLTAINLTADIMFSYDGSNFGLGTFDYNGLFVISNESFELFVDGTHVVIPGLTPARYVWDVTGAVQGLASPVPEPSTYALGGAAFLLGAVVWQRRKSR